MRKPDELISRAQIRGNPRADQHFLVDDRVLDRIPTYATEIDIETDHLLEIGAGTGALTDRLLEIADHVTAIERDGRLVEFLSTEFDAEIRANRLTVIHGDALDVDLPSFSACVSNLPYGISSEIVFRLLPRAVPLVLMFQQEFADRMAAEPDSQDYGRLSVTAQHFATIEIVEYVPNTAFSPQPAVNSAIVRLVPRPPAYSVHNEEFFLQFVKAVFTQRRKTLRNAIRNTTHISGITEPESVLSEIDSELLQRRAGELSPEDFANLSNIAFEHGEVT